MTDEQDNSTEEQTEAAPSGPRCGELLAEARREKQISVLEVAKELHLDEPKVRALERNDFELLGAPVFAKGHLRKYAHLVGVNEDDVLTDYYQMTRQEALPPVVVARRRSRQELSPGPWIAVIVVILVAAAAYWWFALYSAQSVTPPPQSEPLGQQGPAAEPQLPDTAPVPEEPMETERETVEPETAAPEPQVVETPSVEPASTPGEIRLSLSFSGDCWTEVSDATGQQLFFSMGRAGSSIDLTGVAPLAVLFGDVDNVLVRVNGDDYPVRSANPGSRTARLTITEP